MYSAFFYKERKSLFVLASLAAWFGLLGLLGPYLPGNNVVFDRQVTIDLHGNKLVGQWTKINGRWNFLRIAKVVVPVRKRVALAKVSQSAPETTASITPTKAMAQKKQRIARKKAARAALAKEIGRWARIGNRWKWHEGQKTAEKRHSRKRFEHQTGWINKGGISSYEARAWSGLILNI